MSPTGANAGAMAVHGAYQLSGGNLRQTAQYSIYSDESAVHLAVQSILNAFGGQLPIGLAVALSTTSAAVLEQQRAHHAMPREWKAPLDEESLQAATTLLQQRGLGQVIERSLCWGAIRRDDCASRCEMKSRSAALDYLNWRGDAYFGAANRLIPPSRGSGRRAPATPTWWIAAMLVTRRSIFPAGWLGMTPA